MQLQEPTGDPGFVVATPGRSVCDDNARALEQVGRLRFIALGTRRGTAGIPPERTRLNPAIGLFTYLAARTLPHYRAESFRFRLHPWFDRWVQRQLRPGDHILSSYSYTNDCFQWVREHGGRTLLDAGNSHPTSFWTVLCEEHRRWSSPYPPVAPHWYERAKAMMDQVDYVLAPSSFVRQSFLNHGFKPEQILQNVYPVDLSCFKPRPGPRPRNRPLTVINTGQVSLRKGAPYLFEAFRQIRQRHPSARLLLTRDIHDSARPILARYRDLPIDWSPALPHPQLADRLHSADVFVLPSLEDGWARTVCEAMACGLPVVVTPNTGARDVVQPGVNGEVVPIRDPGAIAEAVLKWGDKQLAGAAIEKTELTGQLSFATFAAEFLRQLHEIGLIRTGPL